MEWVRDRIDIVVLSWESSVGMKKVGSCRLVNTLPLHSLYDIAELFADLSILIELHLKMFEDNGAKHALRPRV